MVKNPTLTLVGLALLSLLWGGLFSCAQPVSKKSEGQPCRLSAECQDGLTCRNLVCVGSFSEGERSPSVGEAQADGLSDGSVSDVREPVNDAGVSDLQSIQEDVPELIEPIISEFVPEVSWERKTEGPGESGAPMFQRCERDDDCVTGLTCYNGFCQKACYRFNDPPDCSDLERFVCTAKGYCTLRCRGKNGTDDSSLCSVGMRCERGECVAGARRPQGSQAKGESCKLGGCDGRKGLVCLTPIGQCVSACDPRRGIANNSSCGSSEECVEERRFSMQAFSFLQGVCVPKAKRKQGEPCDFVNGRCQAGLRCVQTLSLNVCRAVCSVENGTSLNSACTRLEHCDGSGLPFPQGVCRPLPARPSGGAGVLNEVCQPGSCDSSKFLFCDTVELRCAKSCRPKDGVNQNPLCSLGEVCIEEKSYSGVAAPRSFLGGRCAASATQKYGEACDDIRKRCRSGLRCFAGRCYKSCLLSQGTSSNPACGSKASYCQRVQAGFGVCRTVCDPRKGQGAHPLCGVGQYCDCLEGSCCVNGVCPERVFCKFSALSTTGRRKVGELCSSQDPNLFCDGNRGLFCRANVCKVGCNPRLGKVGNPNCQAKQECVQGVGVSEDSPLQGMCVPLGVRQSGESCDDKNRCAAALLCERGRCRPSCDPSSGAVLNSACALTAYCRAMFRGASGGGVCSPLPEGRKGKRKLGERCTHSSAFASKSCDESLGLTCDEGTGLCVTACHPKSGLANNPKCGTREACIETTTSRLGGLCAPASTRGLGLRCNGTQWRCDAGLVCYRGACQKPCDPAKGVSNNSDCSNASQQCLSLPGFDRRGQGVCLQICDLSLGVTNNKACGTTQICQSFQGSRTKGLCQATDAPSNGVRKVGQTCDKTDPDLRCEAGQVCVEASGVSVCTPECEPGKGSKACSPMGRVCVFSLRSSSGAYCTTP